MTEEIEYHHLGEEIYLWQMVHKQASNYFGSPILEYSLAIFSFILRIA